jgi:SAM-dependent methyltransferase
MSMLAPDLRREFDRRKPWVTRFTIGGEQYGGQYDAAADVRLRWLQQHFPEARSILELGSLEGGHSFALASWPHVDQVVAVEGRQANLKRARFVQSVLGQDKVRFVQANLERLDLSSLGRFDAVLCLGLLYHLPQPWRLLRRIGRVARGLLLWTHYCEDQRASVTREHYRGRLYREWFFAFEALSGLSPASFWPTREALLLMLSESGFTRTVILEDDPRHEHGPAITLVGHQA